MASMCKKCVERIEDTDIICKNCNTAIEALESNVSDSAEVVSSGSPSKRKKAIRIGITVGCAVLIIATIIAVFYAIFTNDYQRPIEEFFISIQEQKNKDFLDVFPEWFVKDAEIEGNCAKQIHDMLEDAYGENLEFDYKIVEKEEVDEDLLALLSTLLSAMNEGRTEIKKSFSITLDVHIKGNTSSADTSWNMEISRLKGEGWVIFDSPNEFLEKGKWAIADDNEIE